MGGRGKSSGIYEGKNYNGARNKYEDFKKGSTLSEHYNRHNKDFSYSNETEYLQGARNFLEKPPTPTTQSFISKEGSYFRYDTNTNEFGIINKHGGISTYFKPPDGINYWIEQISKYAN